MQQDKLKRGMRLVRFRRGLSGFGGDGEATPIRAFLVFSICTFMYALLVRSRRSNDVRTHLPTIVQNPVVRPQTFMSCRM
jgi:hypothetical protein